METTKNMRFGRLQWVDHVMKMKDEKGPKKTLKGFVEGRRPVGKHKKMDSWMGVELQELEKVGRGQRCLEAED
jgi:hypothetical protein